MVIKKIKGRRKLPDEDQNKIVLFIRISPKLDDMLSERSTKLGVSKAVITRWALEEKLTGKSEASDNKPKRRLLDV